MKRTNKIVIIALVLINQLPGFSQQSNLKLEDVWGSTKLFAKREGGFRSMANGQFYSNTESTEKGNCIVRFEFNSGKAVDTIVNASALILKDDTVSINDYSFSSDEKKILIATNSEAIYRHSARSDYYIFDLVSKKMDKLSFNGKMMYCSISPDGKNVAFVRENNIYTISLNDLKETAVTTDGKRNEIINGATDWVYEEEFSMDVAFSWAPDGSKIAFYKFDESAVKEINLTYYGGLYPKEEKFKYPKAGEANSKVEIYVYDIKTNRTLKMDTGTEREYLPRMQWTNDAYKLSVQRTNRHQNVLELLLCDATTGKYTVILKEENNSFIEITDDLTFLKNGKQFIWTSTQDGYNHIYLYNLDGTKVKQITTGKYDVTKYYGYDEKSGLFFYQSAEINPTERSIYSINISGKKQNLTPENGVHNAEFSSGFEYFIDTYSAYGKPFICTVANNKGKKLRTLEDNKKVLDEMKKFQLSKTEDFSFETSDGTTLFGWMIKPVNFDSTKKYPVLFHVYGGPGKQTVMNQWEGPNYFWHQLMAQKGYIVVSVDNRGTPGRGLDFANCIYKDMGNLEVKDQLSAVSYFKKYNYVDEARIGVWGWSFGGYMTSLLMTKVTNIYKAGIAVAPVINWRYYDNIYTERYLQTPQENPDGYDQNSPITFAKQLNGSLLLVHGSSDDNVHMQNSMDFVNALVKNNKQFEMFIYPNRNHGISGGGARLHLYTKMTDFITKNL
jgi:dipeptidyl-peptidase-4